MQTHVAPNSDVIVEKVAMTFTGGLECEVIVLIKISPLIFILYRIVIIVPVA